MNRTIKKPRRPLMALLMSMLMPGLGQLYNGSWNKASWFFMAFVFFSVPAFVISALYLPADWMIPGLVAGFFMCLLIWVYSALEAAIDARHKRDYLLKDWQGMGLYLLVFVVGIVLLIPQMTAHMKKHFVEAYRIPSSSMEPTTVAGDYIFADKRYNCPACKAKVERGDIVVFTYPNDRNVNYIKRVIGLPGDRVRIRGERVTVNGERVSLTTRKQEGMNVVSEASGDKTWTVIWKKQDGGNALKNYDVSVPVGHVFVLGDNRNGSNDSRFFGTVPMVDIRAKARQIWLSYNRKLGGLVVERSGRLLK